MLIISMILMTVVSVYLVIRRRDILSLYLFGVALSLVVMFAGIITNISKIGGYSQEQTVFLFLFESIQKLLRDWPIRLSALGYAVAIGRTMFPYFLLLTAMECSMIGWVRRKKRFLSLVSLGIPILFLVYYYPPIFRMLVDKRFWLLVLMIYTVRVWIIAYILLAFLLLAIEYWNITISYCRRNFRLIVLGNIGLTAFYSIYAIQDPAQIYNMFIGEYIEISSITYIRHSILRYGYVSVAIFVFFFLILGTIGMIGYTTLNYIEEKRDMILKKKFDSHSLGVSVFAHNVKNQLLASRVIHKKMAQEFKTETPNTAVLQAYSAQLMRFNEEMLGKMNAFYNSLKDNRIELQACRLDELIRSLEKEEYPVELEILLPYQPVVLADYHRLREGLNNLVCNSVEAGATKVSVALQNERLYHVIRVSDNGKGMSKKIRKKIFEPFQSTKPSSTNWGLGLYYLRRMIKNHHGSLYVESKEGAGTTFYILLPKYF